MTKICKQCNLKKDIFDFAKRSRDSYRNECKTCTNKRIREWAEKNKKKRRIKLKKYRRENREKANERARKYREENREKINERMRIYRRENREKIRGRDKTYKLEKSLKGKVFCDKCKIELPREEDRIETIANISTNVTYCRPCYIKELTLDERQSFDLARRRTIPVTEVIDRVAFSGSLEE